jgi:hypothetical protein
MPARLYSFPIDQPAHPLRTVASIASELNVAIRHVRRSRIRLARASLATPAKELGEIVVAMQAVRDRLFELVADRNRGPRAGTGRRRHRVTVAAAESGDLLEAAAAAVAAGIAHINNLAQAWVPVARGGSPTQAVDELRLLVQALADIRTHLLEVHRAVRAEREGERSPGDQLRE